MRLTILFLFFCGSTLGQNSNLVETIMATYPTEFDNVQALAKRLHYDFKTDRERVEAAYVWIVKNIKYDYHEVYETKPKRIWIRYKSEDEKNQILQDALDERLNYILQVKSTLCYGYSNLFKRLCELMNIPAANINGYTKRGSDAIGTKSSFKNHSWNAVYLDDRWMLVDLTWAAGYSDSRAKSWQPRRNDYYFDTNPQEFISTHLPADSNWQLIQKPISPEDFFDSPIYYPTYFKDRLLLAEKEDGVLEADKRMVKIVFASLPKGKSLFYSFDGSQAATQIERIKLTKDGQYEVFIYHVKPDSRQLTLYSDLRPAIDFKLH